MVFLWPTYDMLYVFVAGFATVLLLELSPFPYPANAGLIPVSSQILIRALVGQLLYVA